MPVATRRAYESPTRDDGCRVLVDGLWPRGMTKDRLKLDQWMREIAPSAGLRKWYGHKPEKWLEFRRRYRKELSGPLRMELLEELVERARKGKVTLVFGARDREGSNAAVILEMIEECL